MSGSPESPFTTLAITAVGAGAICAALQASSWQNRHVARFVVALPLVALLLVFLTMTSPGTETVCLSKTKEELQIYLLYSLTSFVFVLVWLGCLDQAVYSCGSVKLGLLTSGITALLVWLLCMSGLLLFVLS